MDWIDVVKVDLQRGERALTLAHLVAEADGRVRVVERLPGGRRIADVPAAQAVPDEAGELRTRADGLAFLKALAGRTLGPNVRLSRWVQMPPGLAYREHDRRAPWPEVAFREVETGATAFRGSGAAVRIGRGTACEVRLRGGREANDVLATVLWREGTLLLEVSHGHEARLGRPETGMQDVADRAIVYPGDRLRVGEVDYELAFEGYEPIRIPAVTVSLVRPFGKLLHRGVQLGLTLGSSSACGARIAGVGAVAEEHARLRWEGNRLWLRDLGSRHGTVLDGRAVGEEPARVRSGAELRLGSEAVVSVTHEAGAARALGSFDFLFVYDSRKRVFPRRMWIAKADDSPVPPDAEALDGRVPEAGWMAVHEELRREFPERHHVVNRMSASSWSFVEDNFHGLYFHDD